MDQRANTKKTTKAKDALMDYLVSEQAVLSACLADDTGRSSAQASERLTEDDFTSDAHRAIFKLIASSTEPINEVDVAIELPAYRAEAIELSEMHGGGMVDRYIEQVENTRNRRYAEHSLLIGMDLLKEGKSAEEIASTFNSKIELSDNVITGVSDKILLVIFACNTHHLSVSHVLHHQLHNHTCNF